MVSYVMKLCHTAGVIDYITFCNRLINCHYVPKDSSNSLSTRIGFSVPLLLMPLFPPLPLFPLTILCEYQH